MKCPACTRPLGAVSLGSFDVELCREGCGGVWFQRFQLAKFCAAEDSEVEPILSLEPAVEAKVSESARRRCPRDGLILMRHLASAESDVEIETCPACAGEWLDASKLPLIRNVDLSDEGRAAAAEKVLTRQIGPSLDALRQASRLESERAEKTAHALRWLSPSHWLRQK